jgi:hypothetical protein
MTKPIKLQTITVTNPNDQTRQAVLNIWFIGKDIVIGGIGWTEYYDYEKQKGTSLPNKQSSLPEVSSQENSKERVTKK